MTSPAALLALGYGVYLLYAFATGALYFYIHPVYIIPSAVTGAVLIALAAVAGGGGARLARPAAVMLALPLALGFLLPPQPLSPAAAGQRGVQPLTLGRDERTLVFEPTAAPESYTIKDWIKAFAADPEPVRHAGKPVRVTGFVHRDGSLPEGWFLVARFVVQCCAVDAQPVGLPVRATGAPPEPGRWVTVEGTWDVADMPGVRRAVIAATVIAPTARPEQPYLY
jgi:putative membrane protein